MSEENEDTLQNKPPTRYEITWKNGHTEYVLAHQVAWPNAFAGMFGTPISAVPRVTFHAYINSVWTLQLSAPEEEIRLIRNAATEEHVEPS